MPFYSSRHPTGAHGQGNLFDLEKPEQRRSCAPTLGQGNRNGVAAYVEAVSGWQETVTTYRTNLEVWPETPFLANLGRTFVSGKATF